MPRPRTPTNVWKLKGGDRQHPERMAERENEPEESRPLGDPPESLTDIEAGIWNELADNAIPGVLGQADRGVLESTCKLFGRMRQQAAEDDVRRSEIRTAISEIDDEQTRVALDLMYKFFGSPAGYTATDQSNLTTLLRQMGMSPADRSKIQMPKKSSKNDFEDV